MAEWIQSSRLNGVLRYQWKSIGRLVMWVLVVVLAVNILTLVLPMITGDSYAYDGIRGNFEIAFFAAFIAAMVTAGRGTRFLLRFGTPRISVWIGNVVGLMVGMTALLLATFVLNTLIGALLFPLSGSNAQLYVMTADQFKEDFLQGLSRLPELMLYTVEWTAMFYLYACVFRRYKVFTISMTIGIPLMFVVLMLIPAVREALTVIESDNQGQMIILGLKWIQILQNVLEFIADHWDAVQLTAGTVSLPLSYLIMRGTKQP